MGIQTLSPTTDTAEKSEFNSKCRKLNMRPVQHRNKVDMITWVIKEKSQLQFETSFDTCPSYPRKKQRENASAKPSTVSELKLFHQTALLPCQLPVVSALAPVSFTCLVFSCSSHDCFFCAAVKRRVPEGHFTHQPARSTNRPNSGLKATTRNRPMTLHAERRTRGAGPNTSGIRHCETFRCPVYTLLMQNSIRSMITVVKPFHH